MGNIIFSRVFLFAFLFLFTLSCASQQTHPDNNDFYLGLLIDDEPENRPEKIKLFENALTNSNIYIRQAAAEQLAILMTRGVDLSAQTINHLKRESSHWWAAAFYVIPQNTNAAGGGNISQDQRAQLKRRALSFLLEFEQDMSVSYSEARTYVLNECRKHPGLFTETEYAAAEARYAITHLRYRDALIFFRAFTELSPQAAQGNLSADRIWPQEIPRLFLEYPNLINDLGRAFQYTSSTGLEGSNLFLQWETSLPSGIEAANDIIYKLIFYAARIARRAGQNDRAVSLFERALYLAPDAGQSDACVWYLLDLAPANSSDAVKLMERYIPFIRNGNYINDLMERHLHRLVSARDWANILKTYDIIKSISGGGLKSGFAWVIARAMQEGYLSAEETQVAAQITGADSAYPNTFFHIAYNTSGALLMPVLYYRKQSADALNLPFLNFREDFYVSGGEQSPLLKFILGFFDNGAAGLVLPYIRSHERDMSPDELRAVAAAFEEAENYPQSIRVSSLYVNNEGYQRTRRDIELMYPRPYLELIETHARQFDIAPSLLFGLIRTESMFQGAVISRAGAVGLMQLMPDTARDMADRIRRGGGPNFFSAGSVIDSTDIFTNVYIGSYYYNYLYYRFNNDQLALMSYNGGMNRVRRWFDVSPLPADLFVETVTIYETRDYGRRVPAMSGVYKELYY